MATVMEKREKSTMDSVCWVAIAVAISTLALLLWTFD